MFHPARHITPDGIFFAVQRKRKRTASLAFFADFHHYGFPCGDRAFRAMLLTAETTDAVRKIENRFAVFEFQRGRRTHLYAEPAADAKFFVQNRFGDHGFTQKFLKKGGRGIPHSQKKPGGGGSRSLRISGILPTISKSGRNPRFRAFSRIRRSSQPRRGATEASRPANRSSRQ